MFTYGSSFYEGKTLKEFAGTYLKKLPPDVTGLISRGSSGNSIAAAMLVLSGRPLLHFVIRKENESSHSNILNWPGSKDILCIVDDFIDSGTTFRKILEFHPHCSNIRYGIVNHMLKEPEIEEIRARIELITVGL